MLRRLFKTGNSIVLSLPREVLQSLGLADGGQVRLDVDSANHRIIISPATPIAISGVDLEFARQVDEFIEQYRPALEELAR